MFAEVGDGYETRAQEGASRPLGLAALTINTLRNIGTGDLYRLATTAVTTGRKEQRFDFTLDDDDYCTATLRVCLYSEL